jgi:hypothetical protein
MAFPTSLIDKEYATDCTYGFASVTLFWSTSAMTLRRRLVNLTLINKFLIAL